MRRNLIAAALACLAALAAILALPHDKRVRFHALADTDYIKAGWIYDRVISSPTPIDVAFIGTSHTLNGVDSGLVEQAMAEAGAPAHVVNLALPHYGDDLHAVIADLLLGERQPRVLVVETLTLPARAAHPAFPLLADATDVLGAPLGEPGQPAMWLRLPGRQFDLFLRTVLDRTPDAVVPDHWDDTWRVTVRSGGQTPPRITAPDVTALNLRAAQLRAEERAKTAEFERWGWLTFRYNQSFMHRLLEAARDHGVQVVFLHLPIFGTTGVPVAAGLLDRYGETWRLPETLMADPTVWADAEHLNWRGAQALSAWLGARLAGLRTPDGVRAVATR